MSTLDVAADARRKVDCGCGCAACGGDGEASSGRWMRRGDRIVVLLGAAAARHPAPRGQLASAGTSRGRGVGLDKLSLQELEVFPPDTRKRVLSTTAAPYRYICKLQADPTVGNCTGTLIAKNKVLTAAHCLRGVAAGDITVIPAKRAPGSSKTNEPFGRVGVTRIDFHSGFTSCGARDFAVLTLARPIGDRIGVWSRLQAVDPAWLLRVKQVNLAGYPRDKHAQGDQLWRAYNEVVTARGTVLEYLHDTATGMSGAPIWIRWQNVRTIIGIHQCADQPGPPRGNKGLLFTAGVLSDIRRWAS